MKEIFKRICFLLAVALCLVSCNKQEGGAEGNEDKEKVLKLWIPEEQLEMTQEMCDLFLQTYEYDNLNIECSAMSQYDIMDRLMYDYEAAADVFLYSTDNQVRFASSGYLYPITYNYDEMKKQFEENAFSSTCYNGYWYGVPIDPYTVVMYYNKNVFSDEDVKSLDVMLSKKTDLEYNFSFKISDSYYIPAFYYAMGCTLYGQDGMQENQCTWNNDGGYTVSKYMLDMLKNPAYYEDISGGAIDYFIDGKLGAYCGGGQSGRLLKDALGDALGVTRLPAIKIDNEDRQLGGFIEYNAFGVNFNTKYPKEAQQLAEWLGGEVCQRVRYEQLGAIPTLTALYEDEIIGKDEAVNAVVSQTEYCVVAPSITKMSLYWDAAGALGTEMINGSITEDNLQQKLDIVVENITFHFGEE